MLIAARDEEGDGSGMTDEQLRDEAMTIFLAGHETTANALIWTWCLLSQHPEIEARFHAEVDEVLKGAFCRPPETSRDCVTPRWSSPKRCGFIRPRGSSAAARSAIIKSTATRSRPARSC